MTGQPFSRGLLIGEMIQRGFGGSLLLKECSRLGQSSCLKILTVGGLCAATSTCATSTSDVPFVRRCLKVRAKARH